MAVGQLKSLLGSIRRKPSTAPDRRSREETNGVNGEKTSLMSDLSSIGVKNVKMLGGALVDMAGGEPLDDKQLLLENGVSMLQSLPSNSGLGSTVSNGFIGMLWNDLPHPAATLAGPESRYRRHDGGGNNPWQPEMGKAGTPYSRSVPPVKPKGPNLPDVELVFEQLLKRDGAFREHPSGLNRLFFSFATISLQDNDIFQLSRNINVGFFATVVLKDYVAAILNTPRANSEWSLDLGAEIKKGGSRVERGTGNVVSTEFAVLYHWHAALSAADAQWMEDIIRESAPEIGHIDDVTAETFTKVVKTQGHKLMSTEPRLWTFGGIKRGADGRFSDNDLGEILKNCVDEPAHAFGAHGTPASLKVVDLMGQLQARNHFKVCTMNEFRTYLNLKAYESFEDWNPDKKTARAAELLYGHIDNLELYPGLMAECTKPAMPGSGVCPGQTTGRGILDDAVALVRGDRFLSYDFNSNTLTNWGFAKLGSLPGGSYGGMLPHLLFTGLPGAYKGTSPYALLPFYTPKAVAGILKGNKAIDRYDLNRNRSDGGIVAVHSQAGCKQVFEDEQTFRPAFSMDKTNFLPKVFFTDGFDGKITKYFSETVARLIKDSSLKYAGSKRSVDIVRDVTNVAPIMWLAEHFAIPLKTARTPKGLLSLPQLFDMYMVTFLYQNFNILPINEWKLRDGYQKAEPVLRNIFETHLKTQQGFKETIVDRLAKGSAYEVGPEADRLYHALNDSKLPTRDLVTDCIGMGAPVAGIVTQQASLLIAFYLRPDNSQHKGRIVQLAHQNDAASESQLQGYVLEGMRHAGVVPGLPRVATKDVVVEDGANGSVRIKRDQTVLIATSSSSKDASAFADPDTIDPSRPRESYFMLRSGLHADFGSKLVLPALAATLREVFKLKNVRAAPGKNGMFTTTRHVVAGVVLTHYLDDNARESPFPTSLTVEYDE
ncbi:uncharacterized protein MYCGRDRAFT_100421 [Zymoseptoria tritici IPO323]|uniref:Linoleate diol synthase n=1 Tax=Zymoseptoria tritici (strain CBS 115943 / IPO323) TaxID=336722 RepID=F9XCR4_ZYMTI|nr:uncharacterized protein MYCGRDRAFT_100421 [Zymoseptoria tritici IPO323]EGP86918.1 hypothetical protein MYCGRDRAFT_100421 [Zymoseptoria tritici IPO323]